MPGNSMKIPNVRLVRLKSLSYPSSYGGVDYYLHPGGMIEIFGTDDMGDTKDEFHPISYVVFREDTQILRDLATELATLLAKEMDHG